MIEKRKQNKSYPAKLNVQYPERLDKLSTFFRIFWSIPAVIVLSLVSGELLANEAGGVTVGLFLATTLMITIRQKYPKWWFDFALELNRFSYRVGAYLLLLTDKYPSTDKKQSISLDVDYPNVKNDLNRWLPLVKWFLAIPHYFALVFLSMAAVVVTIIAWFAILFTGQYPRSLFDFVVGVGRWGWRVNTYAFLLTTDQYPPFSLK
jgi:hypothetical protein